MLELLRRVQEFDSDKALSRAELVIDGRTLGFVLGGRAPLCSPFGCVPALQEMSHPRLSRHCSWLSFDCVHLAVCLYIGC